MNAVRKAVLIGGLQNLWQVGLFFPLNVLATMYFAYGARLRLRTFLDQLVALYLVAGALSFFIGFALALPESNDPELSLNQLKSFVVFLGVVVYFGANELRIKEFFRILMWVVGLTGVAIFGTYVYIFLYDPISLYLTRSAISWAPGWPQRWVMFALIGHFVALCRYDLTRRPGNLLLSLVLLTIIVLSGTRSAVLGLLSGHLLLSCLSKRDLVRSLTVLGAVGLVIAVFYDTFQDAFRLQEVAEYDAADDEDSIGYRISNIWPGIVRSLATSRLLFGWGHAGVAFIPHHYFVNTAQMSDAPGAHNGSAESQYMDVLLRQGVVGLAIFVAILIVGLVYAYKVYKREPDMEARSLWKASLGWQLAIMLHGVTVETLRFPIFSLFFFLFLGMLSNEFGFLVKPHLAARPAIPGQSLGEDTSSNPYA